MDPNNIEKEYLRNLPEDHMAEWDICVVGADGRSFAEELTLAYPRATIWWMEDPFYYEDSYNCRMDVITYALSVCMSDRLYEIIRLWNNALKKGAKALCACDYRKHTVLSFLNGCQINGYSDVTPLKFDVYSMKRPGDDPDFLPDPGKTFLPRYERIYVLCPALYRSGGPEVLHQLVHCINSLGGRADIAYVWTDDKEVYGNPDLIAYVAGHIVKVEDISDRPGIAVVSPEIYVEYLAEYEQADAFLWWLSADNFEPTYPAESLDMIWDFIRRLVPHNLYQSVYAGEFCKMRGVAPETLAPLSDYISEQYLAGDHTDTDDRRDIVLYSPKRGLEFTKRLIAEAPDIQWTPIEKMSAAQVFELMCHSKVYIDFGNHPGKDRLPREAAMCGCCVITGLRGSAGYDEDVSIPQEYKFQERDEDIPAILGSIRKCLNGFVEEQKRFSEYRGIIRSEKSVFKICVEKLFFREDRSADHMEKENDP